MAISRFKTSTLAQGLPKYQKLWDGTTALFDSDYELITRTTVGAGGSSTITFSSIPSTYKHLQIRSIARDGGSGNDVTSFKMTFNSDTTSTYVRHYIFGDGGGGALAAGVNQTTGFVYTGIIAQNGTTANIFGASVIDILDYQNTNKYKTLRNIGGADFNGTASIGFTSGLWQSTSAITNISITSATATNFAQYSSFALYGIKGTA